MRNRQDRVTKTELKLEEIRDAESELLHCPQLEAFSEERNAEQQAST